MKPFSYMLSLMLIMLPLAAQAFSLQWPVKCSLGTDCFIQNYVDRDATPAARDFTCSFATYDKHRGVDIRLRSKAAMRAGVEVLVPTDGAVLGVRDGMEDASIRDTGMEAVKDRECGNGVRIQHGEGYTTQVCHMQKGSIRVRNGQQVKAGDVVGLIGLSGATEFPHLHLTVWKDDVVVDPFDSQPMSGACHEGGAVQGLWQTPVPYQPTALLGDGFSDVLPESAMMRDTPVNLATTGTSIPVLTYWSEIMGVREGDTLSMSITAPDGKVMTEKSQAIPKPMAVYFSYIGKRNSRSALDPGTYRARLALVRGGASVLQSQREIVVK